MAKPKEDNEKNTEWIIAGNPDKYDIIGESQVLGSIDWTQSVKIAVGDGYLETGRRTQYRQGNKAHFRPGKART